MSTPVTPARPALLHNMSAPPKTPVSCDQVPVHGGEVVFSLLDLLAHHGLPAAPDAGGDAAGNVANDDGSTGEGSEAPPPRWLLGRVDPALLRERRLRSALTAVLSGVAPSHRAPARRTPPGRAPSGPTVDEVIADPRPPLEGVLIGWSPCQELAPRQRLCVDPVLTLRVLARCEAGLYLGHRSPGGSLLDLVDRGLVFDDPRLSRLDGLVTGPARADAPVPGAVRRPARASASDPLSVAPSVRARRGPAPGTRSPQTSRTP